MNQSENKLNRNCPCGSGNLYLSCCGLYIEQQQLPSTPEQLMRSRYSAYAMANIDYINKTMQGPAAFNFDPVSVKEWAEHVQWLRLEILNSFLDSNDPTKGFVEFKAFYRINLQDQCLHEISEFHLIDKQWYYVDGKNTARNIPKTKINRNYPCICGSGKKYKKCCGL